MGGVLVVVSFHVLNIDGELPDRSPTMLCKACTVAVTMRKTSAVS